MNIFDSLENKEGELFIGGVSCKQLADKFDTPLYVINENRIRENFRKLKKSFSKHYKKTRIYYAMKANSGISVLRILKQEGSYIDAVSPGEVTHALEAGFKPDEIMFTGTSVRNDELKFLIDSKVIINVDSMSQLMRLLEIDVPKFLSMRVNPEVGAGHHNHTITGGKNSKFGIWEDDLIDVYKKAKDAGVKRFGIQMHIGSGILETEPFILAANKMLEIAKKVHEKVGINFEFIDFGGGLGVPYRPEEKELDVEKFSKKILSLFKEKLAEYGLGEPIFCIEPGRYIVCDAVILLTKVNTIKTTPFKNFIGVDAGFNTLIRPAMYGSYHHILVANKLNSEMTETYDVVGPLCESGDFIAKNRKLPKIEEGDLLSILNAGAYGFSMSSNYNLRPKAAEVLVTNGKFELVREREKSKDLLSHQNFASWLK